MPMKPIYTTIIYSSMQKMGLSLLEYCVADCVSKLSNNPDFPYCVKSQDDIADTIGISREQVNRVMKKLCDLGYLEQNTDIKKYRATQKWIDSTEVDRSDKMSHDVTNNHTDSDKMSQHDSDKMSHKNNIYKNNIRINIYTPILDRWNSKNIVTHRKLTDKIERSINGRLKEGYTLDEILTAIDNYALILGDQSYFWSHKWVLTDFLQRGFEKFKDLEVAKQNYSAKKGGLNGQYQNANRAEKGKYSDIKYEGAS